MVAQFDCGAAWWLKSSARDWFHEKVQGCSYFKLGRSNVHGETDPIFVKGIWPYNEENKRKHSETIAILSSIVFEKGLKKGETAYLVVLIEVKPDLQIEVSDSIAKLLDEFKDVIPLKQPKELPLMGELITWLIWFLD